MSQLNAISDLETLLHSMSPQLEDNIYVFATVSMDRLARLSCEPLMVFKEGEGVTLILEKSTADAEGIEGAMPSKRITLNVHSALEAVGFMAAISKGLMEEGIPCNVVAGYYHDHLFIPLDKVDRAMDVLHGFAAKS